MPIGQSGREETGKQALGIDAVNEFCIKNNYEIIFLALNARMYCDVVLKKYNTSINT